MSRPATNLFLNLAMEPINASVTTRRPERDAAPSSPPNLGIDPPRPAREGYEWVWFPEGYWAEREMRSQYGNSKAADHRRWKWRSKSAKSQSHLGSESPELSPNTVMAGSPGRSLIPQSPYLSEEAHVQSLQNPLESGPWSPSMASRSQWLSGELISGFGPFGTMAVVDSKPEAASMPRKGFHSRP
jgi:hypothetical protein